MKKLISITLTTAMLFMSFVTVKGDDGKLVVTNKLDATNNSLIISGTVETDRDGMPVVFIIEEGNTIVWGDQLLTSAPENGKEKFSFDPFPIPENKLSTTYKITVSAEFANETDVINYSYFGVDKKHEALSKIVDYDNSVSPTGMRDNVIEVYYQTLGTDKALYDTFDAGKDIIAKITSKPTYTCPSGYVNESDISEINSNIKRFVEAYNEAEAIAYLNAVDNQNELKTWVSLYGDKYQLSSDNPLTGDDEAKMYNEYFTKIPKTTNLINRFKAAANAAESFNDLKADIFDKVLLTYIETSNYTKTKEIVDAFPQKFAGINSAKKTTAVYSKVTGTYYNSIAAFCLACNNTVVTDPSDLDSGNTYSPGNSSNTVSVSNQSVAAKPAETGFTDMSSYRWAVEAVNYLRDKGIVSGKTETLFVPEANVTRAEFAKILVNAVGIQVQGYNGEFSDVGEKDWYAPFVSAAAKSGIIMGSDNKFMPNVNITRQDMAVMMMRALNLSCTNVEDVFNDSHSISDYAKEAVFAVYKNGIMRGTGDGQFNPLKNASRAEAAQTVYNMLTRQ